MIFERWAKILSMLGAMIIFAWGMFQYFQNEQRQLESRRIEATKPFLERQLKLYTEASITAAILATSDDEQERDAAAKRFWSLYWGELALVEDSRVEEAMVKLGNGLNEKFKQEQLQVLSLDLARACRDSLAISWGVKEWRYSTP